MGIIQAVFGKKNDDLATENKKEIVKKLKPANLTDQNMEQTIKESDKPVLVDCWASWCGPCQRIAPVVEALADEYKDKVLIAKLNTEQNRKMASKYNIRSIPSFLFFKGGKLVHIMVGAGSKRDLENEIKHVLLK